MFWRTQKKVNLSKSFVATMAIAFSMLGVNTYANAADMNLPYDTEIAPGYSTAVATQVGGYINQLNSYDQAFLNMDMYMLNNQSQRRALKKSRGTNIVRSAVNEAVHSGTVGTTPYSNFENVKLKHGPKVSNVSYGQYINTQSEILELGNGWDGVFGIYAGYNGSHQAYDGTSLYQNGATLGAVGMAYKDNYFAGVTVNTGANFGLAKSEFGKEDFTMFMAGVAAKTGYNWELANGKFIIQPSYKMSYSFINEMDHTFKEAEYRAKSDPLNAVEIEPGLKFIGNFNSGWQPYAGISIVYNIMDKTKTYATNSDGEAALADMRVRSYIRYGFGIRKALGERFSGFFQTYFANGGRNGVGLQFGLNWIVGKDTAKTADNRVSALPQKKLIKK